LASLALALFLAGQLAGCASNAQRQERITEPDSPGETTSEQVASRNSEPAVRIPSEDVAGGEISGLPRYPGSVRVEYERGRRGGLEIVRTRYLTRDGLDAVRGYYRGVFRAQGWEVANVEFYEDEWTFLAIHGEREADVEIEAHEGDVTDMDIELSEPLPERETATKKMPQKKEKSPALREPAPSRPPQPAEQATPAPQSASPSPAPQSASPAPQSASPAPQSASPAPAPGYYGGDDDWDDFGDDDGGGDD
jgi:hypothetical protein